MFIGGGLLSKNKLVIKLHDSPPLPVNCFTLTRKRPNVESVPSLKDSVFTFCTLVDFLPQKAWEPIPKSDKRDFQ